MKRESDAGVAGTPTHALTVHLYLLSTCIAHLLSLSYTFHHSIKIEIDLQTIKFLLFSKNYFLIYYNIVGFFIFCSSVSSVFLYVFFSCNYDQDGRNIIRNIMFSGWVG